MSGQTGRPAGVVGKHKAELEAAQTLANDIPRDNVLRLSLARQVLWGTINKAEYGPVKAISGAGQDGVTIQPVSLARWNPAMAKSGDSRGGALVPGWWIVVPQRLGRHQQSSMTNWGGAPTKDSLRLLPYKLDESYAASTRNSFYIHGTGGAGSDGCVLIDPTNRKRLIELVLEGGGSWLHAYVSGTELNEIIELNQRTDRTA